MVDIHRILIVELDTVGLQLDLIIVEPLQDPTVMGLTTKNDYTIDNHQFQSSQTAQLPTNYPYPIHCPCYALVGRRLKEWCAEFPIEGTVQGAFSWKPRDDAAGCDPWLDQHGSNQQ